MKILKTLALLVVGFAMYPLLFVPLMAKFAPDALGKWLAVYADYLRVWGF